MSVHAPDAARFPLFGSAAALEALLAPGDVAVCPRGWAHHTEGLDLSVSVTCRYGDGGASGSE